ncbi:MAG: DNA polymerase III subunit chi [Steroidobacteraceae bacterium]|nr:DNA polymerase III subunit chi [Steroidobacteraceae bacterium]MDW8260529.1 DNA polymerase III subunit chi [Gammaproteobacteria bacterium]
MTQVDFYLLDTGDDRDWLRFACRLIDKAYQAGHRLVALADEDALLVKLDELLWTFADRAFVPHERLSDRASPPAAPVVLSTALPRSVGRDVLLNLSATVPDEVTEFARVLEIVAGSPQRRDQCREHFKRYRALQLEPATHRVSI